MNFFNLIFPFNYSHGPVGGATFVVNANAETSRFHSFKGLFQTGKFTAKVTHEI